MNKKELLKSAGTLIQQQTTSFKSNYFQLLDLGMNQYSDIEYSQEQIQKIREHLHYASTGSSSGMPMICEPSECPIARGNKCPYINADKRGIKQDPKGYKPITPMGSSCPLETNLLNEWTRLYINEYDVGEESFTEIMMCRELAEIEMVLTRMNHQLALPENQNLIQWDTVGADKQGNPLIKKSVNTIYETKERLQNRKSKLYKLMVGDRQEKYKREAALKVRETDDPSTQTAQLRGRLSRLLNEAKKIDIKIKEADGDIIDVGEDKVIEQKPDKMTLSPEDLINGDE